MMPRIPWIVAFLLFLTSAVLGGEVSSFERTRKKPRMTSMFLLEHIENYRKNLHMVEEFRTLMTKKLRDIIVPLKSENEEHLKLVPENCKTIASGKNWGGWKFPL